MKSKISHIEIKRLRWDYFFSRFVTVFGLLVLATFVTLILHIFGNALPLFQSPDINFKYSVPRLLDTRLLESSGLLETTSPLAESKVELGLLQLQSEWFHLHYENCALTIISLSQSQTSETSADSQPLSLTKKYAPDCTKHPIGLMGTNNQYLAMLSQTGLMEVFSIDFSLDNSQTNIQLNLQGSFNLPNVFIEDIDSYFAHTQSVEALMPNLNPWLAQWHLYFEDDTIALTRTIGNISPNSAVGNTMLTMRHKLSSLTAIKASPVDNALLVQPIINRQLWIAASSEDHRQLHLLDLSFESQQTILLPDDIVSVDLSTNSLDVIVVTQKQQLHKYLLVNTGGQFLLKPGFVINLPHVLLNNSNETSDTEDIKELAPSISMHFDNSNNMLIAMQENGVAFIINSVTGEIANQVALESAASAEMSTSSHVAYARGQMVLTDPTHFSIYHVDNLQGIITLQTLFGKNNYSAYPEPAYVWQTSVVSDVQSPKFSVVPLLMGSLKASLLALIVALPLALGGAIYTAYFAKAHLRNLIKPAIEMLEAIPSVIIGFIAAVWLAPFAEQYLISIFSVVILLPFVVIVIAAIHGLLQAKIAHTDLANWALPINAFLLLFAVVFIFSLSLLITDWSIDNDMNSVVEAVSGLTLSKTAIVVSLALGIAIAPTIYTLIDDALFEVPEGVKQASFALGATPIQTLTKVVLVVALPSIIAAVMLGFGRAFGETMIVLMVTGNTPIANWDLFAGLRTLTSNLAIELQQAQLESTLYYVLFLTAAILFLFTFAVNTVAALLKRTMRRNS